MKKSAELMVGRKSDAHACLESNIRKNTSCCVTACVPHAMSFEQWKMGDKHEAMITLSDCADLLERGNIFDSVEVYKMLISWACDLGRYFDAGRVRQSRRL